MYKRTAFVGLFTFLKSIHPYYSGLILKIYFIVSKLKPELNCNLLIEFFSIIK